MSNVVSLQHIAADAVRIVPDKLKDERRANPFEALSMRSDGDLHRDVRAARHKTVTDLATRNAALAEEVGELMKRLARLPHP